MSAKYQALFRACILLFSLNAGSLFGQEQPIDTSDYVPYIYTDALEYNLMIAASKGYVSEVNRLIGHGADIDVETDQGVTPLIIAVASNKPEVVAALLSHGPDVNKFTALNETPLLIAVKNNYFNIAEQLIRDSADINLSDRHGATPLHYAVLYGFTEMADMLIYYDADINSKTNDGSTPLMASVWAGSFSGAELLLRNGAGTEDKNNEGFTPFLLASWFGDTATMDLLFMNGANMYATTDKGQNALTLAIISDQQGSINYLLRLGKNWEGIRHTASDPYLVASKYSRKDIIDLLRKRDVKGNISYQIDQLTVSVSERIAFHDAFTGFAILFKEPLLNAGLIARCDIKPMSTRVLIKESDEKYYQYLDRGSVAYAGIFKDYDLKKYPNNSILSFRAALMGGYSFGSDLRGTINDPRNKFKIVPSVSFNISKMNFTGFAGLEYIKTPFYKSGPVWLRFGIGYTSFFNNIRTRVKYPKWY